MSSRKIIEGYGAWNKLTPNAASSLRKDDMGMPVGKWGIRRFATNAPGEGGGGPGSTAGILLGQAGYQAWARDMRERGNAVPTWAEGTLYNEEELTPKEVVGRLVESGR